MISDIVQEMRQHTRCSAADAFYTPASWAELCDRLEREEARLIADRDNWRQQALTEDEQANEVKTALREALSGIDEYMTRAIYFKYGIDIERWRAVLEKYAK